MLSTAAHLLYLLDVVHGRRVLLQQTDCGSEQVLTVVEVIPRSGSFFSRSSISSCPSCSLYSSPFASRGTVLVYKQKEQGVHEHMANPDHVFER